MKALRFGRKVSWWYCIVASLIFSSLVARMGTSVMLLKGRFWGLASPFSQNLCWTAELLQLWGWDQEIFASLRICFQCLLELRIQVSEFDILRSKGHQSGSSLLDRLGDGSAALACGQSSQNAWGQIWQQILLIKGLPAHGYNKTELGRLFPEIGSFVGVLGCHAYTYFDNGQLRHVLGIYHWDCEKWVFPAHEKYQECLAHTWQRIRKGKGGEWYSDQREIGAAAVLHFARFAPGHTTSRHERKQRRAPVRQGDSANTAGQKCQYSTTVSAGNIPTGQQVPETLCMRPVHCGELPWRHPAGMVWRFHSSNATHFGAYSSPLKIRCWQDYESKAQFWQGSWHIQHSISASAVSISDYFHPYGPITGKALEWSSIATTSNSDRIPAHCFQRPHEVPGRRQRLWQGWQVQRETQQERLGGLSLYPPKCQLLLLNTTLPISLSKTVTATDPCLCESCAPFLDLPIQSDSLAPPVPHMDTAKYLGAFISSNSSSTADVNFWCSQASTAFHALSPCFDTRWFIPRKSSRFIRKLFKQFLFMELSPKFIHRLKLPKSTHCTIELSDRSCKLKARSITEF